MAILFALVARGSVVLAEFTATATNAGAIARQILEKIPGNNDTNVSYSQDRYVFHVRRTDGLTVLCMADESAGSTSLFSFSFLPIFCFYIFDVEDLFIYLFIYFILYIYIVIFFHFMRFGSSLASI